jgi:hypothetical protein
MTDRDLWLEVYRATTRHLAGDEAHAVAMDRADEALARAPKDPARSWRPAGLESGAALREAK